MSEESQRGQNSVSGGELRSFIERVERLEEEKTEVADAIKSVYAEAKSRGYGTRYIRAIVKLRKKKPSEREEDEAMMELYLSSIGMAKEPPLFRTVANMGVDTASRDAVIEALKLLVPDDGEILCKIGGRSLRLRRVEGEPEVTELSERAAAAAMGEAPLDETPRRAQRPDAPDCTPDEAEELGRSAARGDEPIIANPFPWDDERRARWDLGWRKEAGSDGMGPPDKD